MLRCITYSKQPLFSHIGILDKMNNHQSDIDALHGQMTSQLNIDPELLSGVSYVVIAAI